MVPKKTSCGLEKVRPRLCTRKSTRLCMRIFDSSLHAGPCTRISSSLQWNLRYFTLTFSIVLYHHPLRYFTLLHCALLHYSGSGLQTSELLLYFSAAPLHSRLLRYFSTSGGADFIHCTLLFSPLYSTLRSATLLYCATHYSTSFYITLLLYSTLTLFYSTPVKFTLLYFALYKHSTLLGLWASDFWATCRLPACVCTWSVCSACVCKGTWTLLAPTPPHPQPRMISVQCLRLQVNMNVIGTPPQSTPTPTPPHPCVHRWVKLCVRRWVKKEMG